MNGYTNDIDCLMIEITKSGISRCKFNLTLYGEDDVELNAALNSTLYSEDDLDTQPNEIKGTEISIKKNKQVLIYVQYLFTKSKKAVQNELKKNYFLGVNSICFVLEIHKSISMSM